MRFRFYLHFQCFIGFFSGLVPTLLRDAPFSGVYLMFYRWQLSHMPEREQISSFAGQRIDVHRMAVPFLDVMSSNYSGFARFGSGITAGLSACLVTQPFDMAKTLMQTLPDEHRSLIKTLVTMKQVEMERLSARSCLQLGFNFRHLVGRDSFEV